MTELHPSYGGPFIQKTKRKSPFEVMQRLRKKYPGDSWHQIKSLWVDAVLDDPELNRAVVEAQSINVSTSLRHLEAETPEVKAERIETATKRKAKAVAARVRVQHALLETVMRCTFKQCAQLSKAAPKLAKIAKMGKPDQYVKDVLSEAVVLKVLGK